MAIRLRFFCFFFFAYYDGVFARYISSIAARRCHFAETLLRLERRRFDAATPMPAFDAVTLFSPITSLYHAAAPMFTPCRDFSCHDATVNVTDYFVARRSRYA